jgi:PTH1 family peptidyl-tRNA hydrolase
LQLPLRLIVGLGNPGPNTLKPGTTPGFGFVSARARTRRVLQPRVALSRPGRQGARQWRRLLAADAADLHEPLRPGGAALAHFYRIEPAEMLVVHDELDIPPGQMRLKFGGGLGGHNGLKDITAHLGTQDYWRLRIGIGHPGDRNEVVNFVLKPPRREEREEIDAALDRALLAWPTLAKGEFNAATQKINTVPKALPKETP